MSLLLHRFRTRILNTFIFRREIIPRITDAKNAFATGPFPFFLYKKA